MTNAICTYDFTCGMDKTSKNDVITILNKIAKKWTFQGERGDLNGYEHWQGRFSLKVKLRLINLQKKWPIKGKFSPTSKANKDNNFYVTKEETRIEGPYNEEEHTPIYIPRQVREIEKLYPWQEAVIKKSDVWDTRHIDVIIDKKGNIGKTILQTYMRSYRKGRILPYCNNYKDLLRMVCDMPTSNCYVIDMPRAIDKEKLHSMYSGIESIKNGYAYDDRYHFKEKIFDCPNIWVFTNTVPDMSLVSIDRWRLWEVKGNELVKYEEEIQYYGGES